MGPADEGELRLAASECDQALQRVAALRDNPSLTTDDRASLRLATIDLELALFRVNHVLSVESPWPFQER